MSKRAKRYLLVILLFFFIALFATLTIFLRTELVGNKLKDVLIGKIKESGNVSVEIRDLYINLPTFSVVIKGLVLKDKTDHLLAEFKDGRFYISFFALIRKQIHIKRAVIKGLKTSKDIILLVEGLKKEQPPSKEKGPWKVTVRKLSLRDSEVFAQYKKNRIDLANLDADVDLLRLAIELKKAIYRISGRVNTTGIFRLKGRIEENRLNLKNLLLKDDKGSRVQYSGWLSVDKGLEGRIKARINLESLKGIFFSDLKQPGFVELKGKVSNTKLKYPDIKSFLKSLYLDASLKGELDLQDLMVLVGGSEPIYGRVNFRGKIEGVLENPVMKLKAKEGRGSFYGAEVEYVDCDVILRNHRLMFKGREVRAYGGRATVDVQFLLPKVKWFQLKVVADSLSSKGILKLIKWDPGLPEGKVSGTLYFSGKQFSPSGHFKFVSTEEHRESKNPLKQIRSIEADFNKFGKTLFLRRLYARANYSQAQAEGFLDLNKGILKLDVSVETDNIGELVARGDTSGNGRISIKVRGHINRPVLNGSLDIKDLVFLGIPMGDVQGLLSYNIKHIVIENLKGNFKKGSYLLRGLVSTGSERLFMINSPFLNLNVKLKGVRMGEIEAVSGLSGDLDGEIYGDLTLKGYSSKILTKANIEVKRLRYKGMLLGDLDTKLMISDNSFTLSEFLLRKGNSELSGSLSVKDGRLRTENIIFSVWISDLIKKTDFRKQILFDGNMVLKGSIKKPEIDLRSAIVSSIGKKRKPTKIGNVRITGEPDGVLKIKGTLFEGLSYEATAEISNSVRWNMTFQIRDSNYEDYIKEVIEGLPEDFTFSISGDGSLYGINDTIQGFIEIKRFQLTMFEHNIVNRRTINIDINDNRLVVRSFELKSGVSNVSITGDIDFRKGYDLTLYGVTYLSPLQPFISGVEYLRGTVDFVLGVTGRLNAPVLNGGIAIDKGAVRLSSVQGRFRSIKGYMYLDENRIVLEELTGQYGGGLINLKGSGLIRKTREGFRLRGFNADASVKKINLRPFKGLNIVVSGDLSLSDFDGTLSVIGDMKIIKGRLYRNINWRAMVFENLRKAKKPEVKKRSNVSLNIALYGDRDIKIKSNLFEGDATVDIVVVGSPSAPSILGRIEINKGKLYFRNNEFSIQQASVDFINPETIYPYFSINAETVVRDYRINLVLDGYIDQFDLTLVSDPPLDEVDILSLLTLGRLSGELRGLEGGIGASEATAFLTGELQESVQERIRNLTGFDRIEIEPYVTESTGTIAPRITVFKRLLGDRIYMTYSTLLGDTTEQLIKIEVKLKENISLIGERDETGGIGADIRFRVRFK